jgi:hypothetical protein
MKTIKKRTGKLQLNKVTLAQLTNLHEVKGGSGRNDQINDGGGKITITHPISKLIC